MRLTGHRCSSILNDTTRGRKIVAFNNLPALLLAFIISVLRLKPAAFKRRLNIQTQFAMSL